MTNLVAFVQDSIISGVAGGVAYDGLKAILGTSFDKLANYLKNDEEQKFEAALDMLLSENEELKKQIEELQRGENIQNIIQNNTNGDNIAGGKTDRSVNIGGISSGVIITGDNNKVQ